jgi:hypothetical protein
MRKTATWWLEPLIIPRWMLTAKYVGFAALGVVVFVGGLPTLNFVTPDGYRPIWALCVGISAAVAAVLSVKPSWEPAEKWAAVVLVAWLAVYLVAAIVLAVEEPRSGRWAGVIIVGMVTMLPVTRALSLLWRSGRSRLEVTDVQ